MKKIIIILLVLLTTISITACGDSDTSNESNKSNDDKVFKIGAIPDQNTSKLNRRFEDLAKYISDETGLNVEYVPTVDYSALVTAFERGEIQLGWFGGLTGVQARNSVEGAEAIAQRPRDEEFHSVFIAQKDLGLKELSDIKGYSFTFGSESSTSGHLMPRHFLVEQGIDPDKDFDGEANYSGSHDKTWKLVESGTFDTGALNEAVWEAAVEENKVDLNKVEVFYTTPAYYDYNWTINNVDEDFGKGTKEKVKNALLSIDEDQKEIMELFESEKFIETKNENYKAIKEVAEKLGIIK
ncbi:putative selenate ABC transporter substrate-binding protein [Senegalia massiliensis]|uniref:putative selenate ABC transporter substrate-binding protein n=1 Tax=Senegalia massiliensis TaxID=1720316 RepID=UPI00102FA872|nr:putative selenate ABC transporter substrate-binding protein [Senegalia massiliensis]